MTLLASVTVSWLSYRAEYWILPRQWVASASLVAFGIVWLWAEALRIWERIARPLSLVALIAAAVLVQKQAINLHRTRIAQLTQSLEASRSAGAALDCHPPESLDMVNLNPDEVSARWVELANHNIRCGGSVWPVVRQYYAEIIGGRAAR